MLKKANEEINKFKKLKSQNSNDKFLYALFLVCVCSKWRKIAMGDDVTNII